MSFTLSQTGMVRHWLRLKGHGWVHSIIISGIGGGTTGVVALIVGTTNFAAGAWISMVAIVILAALLWAIHAHYSGVARETAVPENTILETGRKQRQAVIVPVEDISLATLRTADYARSISPNVTALHVTDDLEQGQDLRRQWEATVLDIPLKIIHSPYRSFVAPLIHYIDLLDRADPGQYVTVVLPEFRTRWPWQRWLHNQSSRRLKNALLERPNTVIVEVPYHLAIGIEQALEPM
jgi:hypothetical protein